MISIPCAVPTESFRKQISFFEYQHKKVYGKNASDKAILAIVSRNHFDEPPIDDIGWHINLPYKIVKSVYDYVDGTEQWYLPINVFTAAKQVIEHLPDNEVVEIIDSDLVHLKPHPESYDDLPYDLVVADSTYEDWHMHISKPDSKNREVIQEYLWHDMNIYMNGGFNVIGRVKTIKKIIDDIIRYSVLVTEKYKGGSNSWWCAMYGLNIACHNHRIKMISGGNCYYPNVNNLNQNHYIAHYSCDPKFDKHKIPNVDVDSFPDNEFYKAAKKWLETV